jgi:integrase
MATAYEKRPGKFYARWKDHAGVWRHTATKARTKTEAKQVAAELERRAWRQRMGLEQLGMQNGGGTVRELLTWWMETFSEGNPSHTKNASTIKNHLLTGSIAEVRLADLTKGRIEIFLDEKAKAGLSAQTVNHIRGFLSRAFSAALQRERWNGKNPVAGTKRRKGPKRLADFLRFEEVGPVIAQVPCQHFHRFVTTLYTGLRKGELRALRKTDVDWSLQAIWVRRSGLRETTKGGHEKPIPIHPDLEPVLREAIDASKSDLVFPAAGGGMVRDDFKFAVILRRAMARAGIVEGYLHVCRKHGCGHEEKASDSTERKCPDHGVRLWPKPIVRRITFHHLRHTAGSLFLMSGVPLEIVQKLLRHNDPKITAGVYGHLLMKYQREAIAKVRLLSPELLSSRGGAGPHEAARNAPDDLSLGAYLVPGPGEARKETGTAKQHSSELPALGMERETGFEPATLSLGS